jgi:hypothetical protein
VTSIDVLENLFIEHLFLEHLFLEMVAQRACAATPDPKWFRQQYKNR